MNIIDIPFSKRHHCWFCGEPDQQLFTFPHNQYTVFDCPHSKLQVPTCKECYQLAQQVEADSIWAVNTQVKKSLMNRYKKDLAIGLNWTKEELAHSEFEGGNFEGFKRSAWFVYEVAQQRMTFEHWPIFIDGLEVDVDYIKPCFTVDGVDYPSIDDAIQHYCYSFDLNVKFFRQVLKKVGESRFTYAVRYARLFVGSTPKEQAIALKEL
jgi:hypothetical protein